MGWQVYLVTLTAPHRLGDDLKTKIDLMEKAARKLTYDRSGVAFRKMIGLEGTVRAWRTPTAKTGITRIFTSCTSSTRRATTAITLTPRRWNSACAGSGKTHASRSASHVRQMLMAAGWMVANVGQLRQQRQLGLRVGNDQRLHQVQQDEGRALDVRSSPGSAGRQVRQAKRGDLLRVRRSLPFQTAIGLVKGLKKRLAVVDLTDEEINQVEADDTPQPWHGSPMMNGGRSTVPVLSLRFDLAEKALMWCPNSSGISWRGGEGAGLGGLHR